MFSFMKKGGSSVAGEKDRRKDKEKKRSSRDRLSSDELLRLDEVRRSLKLRGKRSHKEKLPSGITADYSASFLAGLIDPPPSPPPPAAPASDSSDASLSSHLQPPPPAKVPPALPPKPPKRGILKTGSRPSPPAPPLVSPPEEEVIRNTLTNERISIPRRSSADLGSTEFVSAEFATPRSSGSLASESISFATPPRGTSPDQALLPLPPAEPAPLPAPRHLVIRRQPRGDFGFSLRRAILTIREAGTERRVAVILAEPGSSARQLNDTGLLPGDRLLGVNGESVDDKTRDEVIQLIKSSGNTVTVTVQPVAELQELTRRSAPDGGPDQELPAQHIAGGTLRRSGSCRFKNQAGRSEEQLASERAWLEAERVWVTHRCGFSLARRLAPPSPQAGTGETSSEGGDKVRVRLEPSAIEIYVDEDDLEKSNAPQFDRAEDVCMLRFLNESSALHTIRQRYANNLVHTYAGPALLVVNPAAPLAAYSDKLALMFRGCGAEDMPPHVYSTSQAAYRALLSSRRDQAIVFAGRSGAGKSTNLKHAIHYLVMAAGSPVLTVERLGALAIVLESFGCARTSHNTSATRMTTLYSLDVDQAGQIASANIQVLLPERTRVCAHAETELAFHVLYRLLAGAEGAARRELGLDPLTTLPNLLISPLSKQEERQRSAAEFSRLCTALSCLGVSDNETRALWSILAAILHLGAAGATKSGNGTRWQFARPQSAQTAGQLLGVPVEELSRMLFSPPPSATAIPVPGLQAVREFAQGLYGELLNIVTALVNRCICATAHTVASLLLLDTPGLQAPPPLHSQPSAPAGWPELCHNYLAERLQLLFYQTALQAPRDLYAQEQVTGVSDEETASPAPLVRLLDMPAQRGATTPSRGSQPDLSRNQDRTGLLGLLDEQAVAPSGSEDLFLERLFTMHADREEQQMLSRAPGSLQFVVRHLQGTCPVLYCAEGWVQGAKESPIARLAPSLLLDSQREGVRALCDLSRGAVGISALAGLVPGGLMDGSQSLRRASSMRRAGAGRLSAVRAMLAQVDVLMETLRRANVRFVHCLLPRVGADFCELTAYASGGGNLSPAAAPDELLDVPLLRTQLRGAQVLEAARLHKQGFPHHVPLAEFRRQFRLLASTVPTTEMPERPLSPTISLTGEGERQAVADMLASMENLNPGSYRIGLSKVFFRAGTLAQLEAQRDERLQDHVTRFQARCRGYLARRRFAKRKVQEVAVQCIQRNVRRFLQVRDWPWWRLLVRVAPLLNVHRAEEELKTKTEELETLRARLEKVENERTRLKQDTDRLEARGSVGGFVSRCQSTDCDWPSASNSSEHYDSAYVSQSSPAARLVSTMAPVLPPEIAPPTPPSEDEEDDPPSIIFDAEMCFLMRSPSPRVSQRVRACAAHLHPNSGSANLSKRIGKFLSKSSELIKGRSSSPEWWSASSRATSVTDDELSELSVALSEEHSAATLASERLEAETSERIRLQQELDHVQTRHGELQQASERLEMELLFCRAADMNGSTTLSSTTTEDEGDADGDGPVAAAVAHLKQRLERSNRELALTKRRLTQQHEDDLEQMLALKKMMEKKIADAYEEVEEQRQVAAQWKRKAQRVTSEGNDSRLLFEEQAARNVLLEKRQRKFDTELQQLQEALRQEKAHRERATRERDLMAAEKSTTEQNLAACRLELDMRDEKVGSLTRELEELQFGGAAEEEVAALRKSRHTLDMKLKEQEEELDDLAGQVSLLEQAKLRLEMSLEQARKEMRRELSQRDDELEEARCNAQKKVKALECQLEAEHEERTRLLREKHELERRLNEMSELARGRAPEDEQVIARLRRDLRHTKALLRDAHTMVEKYKSDAPGKGQIRQLRHQLEDAEFARNAALRAKQVVETELREAQASLEEITRARADAEDRAAQAVRERTEARGQLEENEEEMAEVMRKYRAAVAQVSQEQAAMQEVAAQIATIEAERNSLKEQLAELTARVESAEGEHASSLTQRRLEMRVRELESRLELEQTTRGRIETQISRLKDSVDKLQSEGDAARARETAALDNARRLQRQLREAREAEAMQSTREADWARRRKELEIRAETAEAESATARTDLRLALQRVEDLQAAMAGELNSSASGSEDTEGESDSDESIGSFMLQHKSSLRSASHVDTLELDFSCRSPEGQSDPGDHGCTLSEEVNIKANESHA